jgi:uncharacterized protein YegP (UPF0339 family)
MSDAVFTVAVIRSLAPKPVDAGASGVVRKSKGTTMENPLRFEIRPDTGGGCHVRLVDAANHEIIFWTENYRDIRSARQAILLAKRNVARAPIIDFVNALLRYLKR